MGGCRTADLLQKLPGRFQVPLEVFRVASGTEFQAES
jgi:hypothetical protein